MALATLLLAGFARAQPDLYLPYTSGSVLLAVDGATGGQTGEVTLPGPPTAIAVCAETGTVYIGLSVTNSAGTTIEIIPYDPLTGSLGTAIPLTTTKLGNSITSLAVDAAGTALYAASSSNTVYVIDLPDGTVATSLDLGGYGSATDIAISPNGHTLYFALPTAAAVGIYDPLNGEFGLLNLNGASPLELALNPAGSRLYVTEPQNDSVAVFDTNTGSLLDSWTTPSYPEGIAVSPDGTTAYVASAGSDVLAAYDASSGQETATVALPAAPSLVALSPDGTELYVLLPSLGSLALVPTPDLNSSSIQTLVSGQLSFAGDFVGASDISVVNQSLATTVDTSLSGNVSASDLLGRSLTLSLLTLPSHGQATINPTGSGTASFEYTPDSGYIGIDRFTYLAQASEGPGEPTNPVSVPGVVRICVEPTSLALTAPSAVTIASVLSTSTGPSSIAFTTNAPCGTTYRLSSSNTTLFPQANLGLAGLGTQRDILVTPAPKETGSAVITLQGTTSEGAQASTTITVDVANPPTIASLPSPIGSSENSSYGPLPFTVSGTLPITVTATSDNPSVVPDSGIVIKGSGTSWSLTVTPAKNVIGSAQITITATDGNGLSSSEVLVFDVLSTGSSGGLALPTLGLLMLAALLAARRRRVLTQ